MGRALFVRSGRRLVATSDGRLVADYAADIFGLDQELRQALASGRAGHRARFRVGLGHSLPKFLGHAILAGARRALREPVHLVVHQADVDGLVADLALHHLDIALTDRPVASSGGRDVRAVLLGESPISLFGTPSLIERYGQDLPGSLADAPFLMPERGSAMRRLLEEWFVEIGVEPQISAEFTDSGMLKTFGEDGWGFFSAPAVVADHVRHTWRVEELLTLVGRRERFYALIRPSLAESAPVDAVLAAARALLGSSPSGGEP